MTEVTKRVAARRGYMAITTRTRGKVGRNRLPAHRAAAKGAWHETAIYFHANLRDKRFTPEHALEAKYAKRRGQHLSPSSPDFKKFYYGRKYSSPKLGGGPGKANPLEKSGDTRRAARHARISSTSKGGRASYSRFRFNSRGRVRPNEEFRRFTRKEIPELAEQFDENYDEIYNENDK